MEREANLPPPPSSSSRPLPSRSLISSSATTTSASSAAAPPSHFLRQVQAAFKRIRPHDKIQASGFRARRILIPERESLKNPASDAADLTADTDNSLDLMSKEASAPQELIEQRKISAVVVEGSEDSSVTKLHKEENKSGPFLVKKIGANPVHESQQPQQISSLYFQKAMQCSSIENANLQRAYEQMGTRKDDDLSSHLSSLGLTEMETSAISCQDLKQCEFQLTAMSDISLKSDGGMSSLLAKRKCIVQDQHHQFPAFLGKDVSQHPLTQSSVAASTCATTTSVHSRSAPLLNYTTYSSRQCRGDSTSSHMEIEPLEEVNLNPERVSHRGTSRPVYPTSQCSSSAMSSYTTAAPTQVSISSVEIPVEGRDHRLSREQQGLAELKESDRLQVVSANLGKNSSVSKDKSTQVEGCSVDTTCVQSQAPMTKSSTSDVKMEPSKPEKSGKATNSKGGQASRKKNYDPDLFFKVNGKLYQKLGKIGTGGSSEVYKVISADCTIYALKKIKLKGRDYSTAYGFCQEIEYLTRLKGRNNIIQLIDYEVTDKTLLTEVLNGSKNVKDSRIRDDGYIYMVLEYGEIDLAHMLSQKWKEMDGSNWNIDENWLRFYWQQILQAVNTIHEERIVHSDLKPANFLLVRGSLKLIDFGIAKAIMSDTTNIQRDSQVGTLSYMSPEAFMCNENDANGNPIKCGRPSDIWSLGCILYQMVYGRTPFSDYKTFWAKFKVITDRNHEIVYGPVSNPWLIDLLKKCLAWERNERWRIPQLLQHPFLVPPLSSQDQGCKLFQQLAEAYASDDKSSRLCFQLQQLLSDPVPQIISGSPTSLDQHCKLLSQMSSLCSQLQQHLTILVKDGTLPSM